MNMFYSLRPISLLDYEFGHSTVSPVLLGQMGIWQNWLYSWSRRWNIPNLSQPNRGTRPPEYSRSMESARLKGQFCRRKLRTSQTDEWRRSFPFQTSWPPSSSSRTSTTATLSTGSSSSRPSSASRSRPNSTTSWQSRSHAPEVSKCILSRFKTQQY